MKARRIAVVAAAIVCLAAASTFAQYYVPLRYDLRSPQAAYARSLGYVPGRGRVGGPAYGYEFPRYDPYSFEAVQRRNYFVTGNVRAGKSFQGTVPYWMSGSQIERRLPSLRLSDFRRDSVGIEDIGTGVEYGLPAPYFAESARVTTAWSAGQRFAPPPPPPAPGYYPAHADPALGVWYVPPTPGYSYAPPAAPYDPGALASQPTPGYLEFATSQATLDWVDAMLERTAASGEDESEETGTGSLLWTRTGTDRLPTFRFEEPKPQNIFDPDQVFAGMTSAESPETAEEPLQWTVPGAGPPTSEQPREAAAGQIDLSAWPAEKAEQAGMPGIPGPYVAAVPFGAYVKRAHAAMRNRAYGQAESLYGAAATLEPDRPSAAFGRVHALLGAQRYNQAAVVVGRLLTTHPDWAAIVPDITAVYPNPEDAKRILAALKDDLRLMPDNARFNFLLGYVLYAAGRPDEARPCLRRAARADQEGPERVLLQALDAQPEE